MVETGVEPQVGVRIRELRLRRRMSVTELARQAEVSKSLISQIERGISNPSLPVLRVIAKVLGVPLFTLFVEGEAHSGLVRQHERQRLHIPGSNVVRELIVPDIHRRITLVASRLEPGEVTSPEPASHPGEECVLVLSGIVQIEINSDLITLYTGDSFYFDSKVPHVARNVSDEPAEILAAICPPFRQ